MKTRAEPRGTREARRAQDAALAVFLLLLVLAFAFVAVWGRGGTRERDPGEERAALSMRAAMLALRSELGSRGISIDPLSDLNGSGLIGLPWSGITTTLGSLPAKRSAAQPASAVMMRRFLRDAGVGAGDLVAIDSSGSFPGFAIAAIIAAEGLGAKTIVLTSVGSSTWGANRPEFALPDMLLFLASRGIVSHGPGAVSPGGDGDAGRDMDATELGHVLARASSGGARLLGAPDLSADIVARRALIARAAGGGRPAVFVSIGGNLPATGPGDSLSGRSGLLRPSNFPGRRAPGIGLVQSYLAEGIPVIRLIDVKDLAARTGLPYDPHPWPPDPAMPAPSAARPWLAAFPCLALAVAFFVRKRHAGSKAENGPRTT
ncbi:MAG: poly-gamma-glutamate system protein [Spirochaetota bacterium]